MATQVQTSAGHNNFVRHRTGHWLPSDHRKLRKWVDKLLERCPPVGSTALDPVLQDFKNFIEDTPVIRPLAVQMFVEVPVTPPYNLDPTIEPQIRTYDEMFAVINVILTEGPQWYTSDDVDAMGLIGFPINAILDWPMGTRSGYDFFTRREVNVHWKAVLDKWGSFLASPASVSVLDPKNGWLSKDALDILATKGDDGVGSSTFAQLYNCDPNQTYYGFTSWDDFFTRTFRPGVRPVAYPDDGPPNPLQPAVNPTNVLVHACESTPCFHKENVKLQDTFWLKSQPYSLAEMFSGNPKRSGKEVAGPFVGGQVYQAFLSALSYHRWHAPVSGVVVDVWVSDGTYYSENFYEGFANMINNITRPDPNAPNNSQPYIAEVATRGIILIQADNPNIGLMACIFIGMCEVSSCVFSVAKGSQIIKGQEIGSFHFGGSTHCLVFRPQTKLNFVDPGPYENEKNNKKVLSELAVTAPTT